MEARFVYVTCANREEALKVGRTVVEKRLAACANILDNMTSIYWWEGKLTEDSETVLVFKSHAELMDELIATVKAVHGYSVPCVVALPILEGNPDYLTWLEEETSLR